MDDFVNPTSSVADNIAKIDLLHEQHRHQKLRELVDQYNRNPLHKHIPYDDTSRVYDLIIGLWNVKVDIPPELTFGEPYDSCFKRYMAYGDNLPGNTHDTIMRILFRYASDLTPYLLYNIQNIRCRCMDRISDFGYSIWLQLPNINQGQEYKGITQFMNRVKYAKLSQLDLIYICIRFESDMALYRSGSIGDFVTVVTI